MTKALIRSSVGLNETIVVIPGVFDIAYVRNSGAAFGMLPGRRDLFVVVALAMIGSVALYWWREHPTEWPVVIPLGLVVGGAIGNLVDRASSGLVTDWLAFSFFSPVFNLADCAIVVGVSSLVVWILFGPMPGDAEVAPAASGDFTATQATPTGEATPGQQGASSNPLPPEREDGPA